ncbi:MULTISPECIES: hypothetical protein [unclassified Bartonella]|uniref:hypothetical protein n=1 Tax=unclassified Bartonella TaxID=2645622 RepID=UPI0035CF2C71
MVAKLALIFFDISSNLSSNLLFLFKIFDEKELWVFQFDITQNKRTVFLSLMFIIKLSSTPIKTVWQVDLLSYLKGAS